MTDYGPLDQGVTTPPRSEHSAETDAILWTAFDAITGAAAPDDWTRHLPNCGYTHEVPECGCAEWGGKVHEALRTALTAARAEVANAYVEWAAKNEIAEPPLDWAWFGEITRRYSPLHEEHPDG